MRYLKQLPTMEKLKLNSEQANKMKVDIDGGIPTKTKTGTAKYIPVGNQNIFQGYLFGEPMPIDKFEALLGRMAKRAASRWPSKTGRWVVN